MMSPGQLRLDEVDATTGQTTKSYVLSTTNAGSQRPGTRLDLIQRSSISTLEGKQFDEKNVRNSSANKPLISLVQFYTTSLVGYLATLFLPIGYPNSVTADYTPYQIYDSIQAFSSSIASLLSSRAVLQSLDIVSSASSSSSDSGPVDSASAATAATLLSVFRATLSNVTTILFASRAAPRISSDVKFYRFLADVVNDAAFVLDLLAPSLPRSYAFLGAIGMGVASPLVESMHLRFLTSFVPSPRTLALCASSMLRAVCGVAGGSSKAVLSSHFARNNPDSVGDLNAKDSSQETVIVLLGMWAGGFVVSRVEGMAATWTWMFGLLFVHLWTNWRAVKSIRLHGLNKERAGLCMEGLRKNGHNGQEEISVHAIGRKESVLGLRHVMVGYLDRWRGDNGAVSWRHWRIGVSVAEFCSACDGSLAGQVNLYGDVPDGNVVGKLVDTFAGEEYVMAVHQPSYRVVVAFKTSARPVDQFKAWHHAFVLYEMLVEGAQRGTAPRQSTLLASSLQLANAQWPGVVSMMEKAGWDLQITNLEDGNGLRLVVNKSTKSS